MEQIIYKTLNFKRRFGLEIELSKNIAKESIVQAIEDCSNYKASFCYRRSSINNNLWHIKTDNSCGEPYRKRKFTQGWEIASFVGRNPDDIIHISQVATALKEIGARVNPNCGLHIHAEVTDFLPRHVGILLAYWIKIEHILRRIIASYRVFDYCFPLEYCWRGPKNKNFDPVSIYNFYLPPKEEKNPFNYRFFALNIVNYYLCLKDRRYKRKTLELRLPESTLEADDIIGWTRLYLNFIEYVKTAPMPSNLKRFNLEDAMACLGLHHDDNFYLFGSSLNKTRIWFLNKLKNNSGGYLKNDAKNLLNVIKN